MFAEGQHLFLISSLNHQSLLMSFCTVCHPCQISGGHCPPYEPRGLDQGRTFEMEPSSPFILQMRNWGSERGGSQNPASRCAPLPRLYSALTVTACLCLEGGPVGWQPLPPSTLILGEPEVPLPKGRQRLATAPFILGGEARALTPAPLFLHGFLSHKWREVLKAPDSLLACGT